MLAGRDLDKLIAIEVFKVSGTMRKHSDLFEYACPSYSTKESDAFKVVSYMVKLGVNFSVDLKSREWKSKFKNSNMVAEGCSNDLPHSICLAAIQFVRRL